MTSKDIRRMSEEELPDIDYFLNKFSSNLNEGGIIIIDNMNLDDFWIDAKKKKKDKFHKINDEFKKELLKKEGYNVQIREDIGDGIAIITKK